jgi:hypothetical protein
LLDGLSQNRRRFIHKRTRSNPFFSSGASRARPKNSTYVLYSPLWTEPAFPATQPSQRHEHERFYSTWYSAR